MTRRTRYNKPNIRDAFMKAKFRRWLNFLKDNFPQEKISSGLTYIFHKVLSILRITKKAILYCLKNPLDSIPKVVSILLFLGFLCFLGYYIFSEQIFIEDVEIQGEAKEQGYTGELLTEQAIALMPSIIKQRLDSIPTNASFLEMIKRYSDNYQTEHACNFTVPIFPPDYGLFITGINRVEMSSKTPDQVITSQSLSIKKLAYWIRKKLNMGVIRQLKPILWKQNEKFIIKIYPIPYVVTEQQRTLENVDEVPKVLASMLLDYISPEISAAELVGYGLISSEHFFFPEAAAKNFLKDRQKQLLIGNAKLSSQLDFSKTQANIESKYKFYEKDNQMLLEELDFRSFGQYGVILKTLIANRILRAKCYVNCSNNIVDAYISNYRKELEQSPYGQITLLFLDSSRSDMSYFYTTLDQLLKKDLRKETDGLFSNLEVALVAASGLIQSGNYKEALKILETPLPKTFDFELEPKTSVIAYRSMKAGLKALQGDFSEYKQIQAENFGGIPCAELIVTGALSQAVSKREKHKINITKGQISELVTNLIASYERLEKNGINSFIFYNQWGIIEKENGDYQVAYKKYEQALRFEGDQAWVLLNWGWAAFEAKDYSQSIKKFRESLMTVLVPSAVYGLLNSLSANNDSKQYLIAYKQYFEVLTEIKDENLKIQFSQMAYAHQCRIKDKSEFNLLIEKTHLGLEKFNPQICGWL